MSAYPTIPPPPRTPPLRIPRPMQFAFFLVAIVWYAAAQMLARSAARGIVVRLNLSDFDTLLESVFVLFLVVMGVALLSAVERRKAPLRMTLGLPKRATAKDEWGTGLAIGWGVALVSVVAMAVFGRLRVHLWTEPRAYELLALSLLALALGSLAHTLGIYGYAFQRLIAAIGPVRATVFLVVVSAIHAAVAPAGYGYPVVPRMFVEGVAALVLAVCWLRTHGVWLMWGLHFGWAASTAVLFGLPMAGMSTYSSIVETRAIGRLSVTGGAYGPGAAFVSGLILLAAIVVVVKTTSEYAWKYTHPQLIPAGYDVTIAPPAAHVAMEASQAAAPVNPASLVQILPMTPQQPTAPRPPE